MQHPGVLLVDCSPPLIPGGLLQSEHKYHQLVCYSLFNRLASLLKTWMGAD